MKQKLLFSLLALLVSVGVVKAQIPLELDDQTAESQFTQEATSPAGKLTITGISGELFVKGGAMTNYTKVPTTWTIPANSSASAITYSFIVAKKTVANNPVKYTGVAFDGFISAVKIENAELLTIAFTNNGYKLNNAGLVFASVDKLTSFSADQTGLTALPATALFDATKNVTINISNTPSFTSIATSDVASFSSTNTTAIKLDGNKVTTWYAPASTDKVQITYGTQVMGSYSATIVANKWHDFYNNVLIAAASQTQANYPASEVNYTWTGLPAKVNPAYPGQFTFYSGEYKYGKGEVTFSNKSKASYPKYKYSFSVDEAEFKLIYDNQDSNGNVFEISRLVGSTYSTIASGGVVKQGETLYLTPKPKVEEGYSFTGYTDVKGLTKVTDDAYLVKGDGEKQEVSIKANFKVLDYKVNYSVQQAGGTATVKYKDGQSLASGTSVPFGTELEIYVKAHESQYAKTILINGKAIPASPVTETGLFSWKDENTLIYTVKEDLNINVQFETGKRPKFSINFDGNAFDKVRVNGVAVSTGDGSNIPVGNSVTINVDVKAGYKLKNILLDGVSISTKPDVTFTMPSNECVVSFEVVQLTTITVNPITQNLVYNGKNQPIEFTTTPAGVSGFTVKYSRTGLDTYKSEVPKEAGTYDAWISRAEDDIFASYNEDKTAILKETYTIAKATPVINSQPTVTVNGQYYNVNGGTNQSGVTGKFVVTQAYNASTSSWTDVTNNLCVMPESHLVRLAFVTENANYHSWDGTTTPAPANVATLEKAVKVGATALPQYTLSAATNLPAGFVFTFKNGNTVLNANAKVEQGTSITISLAYPIGYAITNIKEDNATGTVIGTLGTPAPHPTDVTKMVVEVTTTMPAANLLVTATYSGSAAVAKDMKVDLINEQLFDNLYYEGKPQSVKAQYTPGTAATNNFDFTVAGQTITLPAAVQAQMKISYINAKGEEVLSPINAGKYTIRVTVPAFITTASPFMTIKETKVDFIDKYVVKKADGTNGYVIEWTKPTRGLIAPGKPLQDAKLIGGSSNIAGTFAYIASQTIPTDGTDYPVKFIPEDTDNFEVIDLKRVVPVEITNRNFLAIESTLNGTVTVKDRTGKEYRSGSDLPVAGTELIITATPAAGWGVASLTVNDKAHASGTAYKVGDESITVKATFTKEGVLYNVNLSKMPRGVQLVSKSGETVAYGKNYTFTLATAQGDVPVVEDEDGTRITPNADGVYTLEKVEKEKTISISLTDPTALKLTLSGSTERGSIKVENLTAPGATTYFYGDTLRLTAVLNEGYELWDWNDGEKGKERMHIMTKDATFGIHISPTAIESVENLTVYGGEGYIYVAAPGEVEVTVVSLNGRSQKVRVSGDSYIRDLAAGVYGVVVQQGNSVSKLKVMVK